MQIMHFHRHASAGPAHRCKTAHFTGLEIKKLDISLAQLLGQPPTLLLPDVSVASLHIAISLGAWGSVVVHVFATPQTAHTAMHCVSMHSKLTQLRAWLQA